MTVNCGNDVRSCRIPKSVLNASPNPKLMINYASGKAYLLLHGLASGPDTWNDVAKAGFGGTCVSVTGNNSVPSGLPNARCFAQAFSAGSRSGLENFSGCQSGDASNYWQLGSEITDAMKQIQKAYPGIGSFVLVGHSRGGLAARAAFALNPFNDSIMKKARGLLTIGTPHKGSVYGRVYAWLAMNPRPAKKSCLNYRNNPIYCDTVGTNGMASELHRAQAWAMADLLKTSAKLDVRCPTVDYLSVDSQEIADINVFTLPQGRSYAKIISKGIDLGGLYGINGTLSFIGVDIMAGAYVLPEPARQALLCGVGRPACNLTPASFVGDGIVHENSQWALPTPSLYIPWTSLDKVYHARETGQTDTILKMMKAL